MEFEKIKSETKCNDSKTDYVTVNDRQDEVGKQRRVTIFLKSFQSSSVTWTKFFQLLEHNHFERIQRSDKFRDERFEVMGDKITWLNGVSLYFKSKQTLILDWIYHKNVKTN